MKIIGTGLSGLIGTRITYLLGGRYEFQNISRSTGVDITDSGQVSDAIRSSDASVVLHMAAKTDVDGCETDKALGEEGGAWKMNVTGTQNVVQACIAAKKKIIYISTDFVFDGMKPAGESYTEADTPKPVNWYGMTKYKGEEIVQDSGLPFVIMRPAYPYTTPFPDPLPQGEGKTINEKKKDFVQAILSRLLQGKEVFGLTDHIFVPTYIDDIASALDRLITGNQTGIFHAVGGEALTPYDASVLIADTFGIDKKLVKKTTRAEYFRDRALRPCNLSLKSGKIEQLGLRMRGFEEGLRELKVQS